MNDFLQSPLVGFLNRNTRTGLIKLRTLNGTTHQFQVLYTKARATGVRKSPECKTLLRMERTVLVLLLLLWHPDTGTPSTHYQRHNSGSIRFSIMLSQQCAFLFTLSLLRPIVNIPYIGWHWSAEISQAPMLQVSPFTCPGPRLRLTCGLDCQCPGIVLYHRTDHPLADLHF